VDEKRTDLKAALRELAAEEAGDAGPHVGLKRLTAYRRGALPEAEREAMQEHLSLCARCTGLLRELKDFEADAASGDAGPEALRQAAWKSLSARLAPQMGTAPPLSDAARREAPPPRRSPWLVYTAAAALLLAVIGLSLWTAVTVQQSRQRLTELERRLEQRERELDAARVHIRDLEREKATDSPDVGSRVDELTARVAALTSALEALRGHPPAAVDRPAAASREIALAVSPRFALRGQDLPDSFLRQGGAMNPVRIPAPADAFTVALSLAGQLAYDEYRIELVDRDGKTLWTGRRPAGSLLGDAGTSVSIHGLGPGLYRLRIAGLPPGRSTPLAEYLLEVQVQVQAGP
jgi:hypothetical protein